MTLYLANNHHSHHRRPTGAHRRPTRWPGITQWIRNPRKPRSE